MRVFLDTETTSLQPGQIAQLAYIITDDDLEPLITRNYFFRVTAMDRGAAAVNGFCVHSLMLLSGGRQFADHFRQIGTELADNPLICHNIAFDRKFLSAEYTRLGQTYSPRAEFCTMCELTAACGKRPKLSEAAEHFSVEPSKIAIATQRLFAGTHAAAHDARYDVTTTLLVARKARAFINPWIEATKATYDQALAKAEAAASALLTTPTNRQTTPF